MAWALGDEEPRLWILGGGLNTVEQLLDENPRMFRHVQAGLPVIAHNAPFELEIWNNICVPRYGWPVLKPEQTHCTMALAYAMGLPGALEDAAQALGLRFLKDTDGRALMLRYARPWRESPLQWMDECPKFTVGGVQYTGQSGLERLYEYCRQDVRVERELHSRLMPLSAKERKVWLMDYAINQRGIAVDVETAKAATKMADEVKEEADAEISKVTQGAAQTHTAVLALKGWIKAQGVDVDGLAKSDVVELLSADVPPGVRRVLTLRQEAGKASTAKLKPLIYCAGADNRLRQILQYHGAATGRWAGRKVQPHNLPRDTPDEAYIEEVFALIRQGEWRTIDAVYGPPLSVLSRCLKGFFEAPPGKVLIAGDFANVEGRGVAWFSGEDWKVKAFRDADAKQGPGVYELTYAKSFGVPVSSVKNPSIERQIGKVQELLLGYGGGIGALRRGGGALVAERTDAELDGWKYAWRETHPNVVQTWRDLERAAIKAVRSPGEAFEAGYPGRAVKFKTAGSFLWCLLPSSRCLCYPYPKILADDYGGQLTYMTVPGPSDKGKIVDDPANSPKWARAPTYGGALMENVIQAMCRDLLVDSMLTLDSMGAAIVLHVHDEIVIEVSAEKADGAREKMQEIMRSPPEWAAGFPLFCECEVMRRYG
jgi:DNA polymerase